MSEHLDDPSTAGEPAPDETAEGAATGIPPIPGPPPGVPDEDAPDDARPPINLGVMDPG